MKNKLFPIVRNLLSFCALSFMLLFSNTYAQMHKFPLQNPDISYKSSFLFLTSNNNLLFFWYSGTTLQQSRSTDNGITWGSASQIADTSLDADSLRDINCFTTATGRILLIYKNLFYYLKYSDDNGTTWSYQTRLLTGINILAARNSYAGNISQSPGGKIFFIYSKTSGQNVSFITSTDNGLTWSSQNAVYTGPGYGSIVPSDGSNLLLFYQNKGIYKSLSTDDGTTWSNPVSVISDSTTVTPRAIKDQAGKIWLFYVKNIAAPFNKITQTDILYRSSTDNGTTWTSDFNFTNYKGMDNYFSVSNNGNFPVVSFSSNRFNGSNDHYNMWYGTSGIDVDINTPPYFYQYIASNLKPPAQTPFKIYCYLDYNYPLTSVNLNRTLNGNILSPVLMHDNGLQGDSVANDKIYTGTVPGLNKGDGLVISFTFQDQIGNVVNANGPAISIPLDQTITSLLIDVNKFQLPINNSGILADVLIPPATIGGAKLDNKIFLFSAGFYLSGFNNGNLWANGMASGSRVTDYLPGKVGSFSGDAKNIIYVVRSSDIDFGSSWQNWIFAVSQGADFYDGDHDGIYNPVDKNANGKWDPDEDRPANLGDITAWCVYNDGLQSDLRTFNDVQPQGIEIRQTVFAKNSPDNLGNIVFVKYRIINTGSKSDILDSVYFGAYSDADIGDNGAADLDGCDTLINAAYTYHSSQSTTKWGSNPPAFFIAGLQGPLSYIPGITYIDNNSNGIYDQGIDTPLDTAYNRKGIAGIQKYPGAKNIGTSSFIQYYNGIDPANRFQARFYSLGLNNTGIPFNPCIYPLGSVLGGIDCNSINPIFMYSGDPVTNIGWLNNTPEDQRFISNYGPFQLRKNQPVDIILAYVIGRGSDALNSLSVARNITATAKDYYASNFSGAFTSVLDKNNNIINTFRLDQNYPNPFNPNTKIKYNLPVDSHIKLTIYNTIGQVVKVLANNIQKSGSHEINFNASVLSSGVYFYTLQSTSIDGKQVYTNTKKMILLK
jgi:hypothetical protein